MFKRKTAVTETCAPLNLYVGEETKIPCCENGTVLFSRTQLIEKGRSFILRPFRLRILRRCLYPDVTTVGKRNFDMVVRFNPSFYGVMAVYSGFYLLFQHDAIRFMDGFLQCSVSLAG